MNEHFQRLLDRYFEGALDEEEQAEFEALLSMSRERRAEFWRQAHLIEAIRKQGRESRGEQLAFTGSPAPRKKRSRRIIWMAGAFAAAAAVVIVFLLPGKQDAGSDDLASSPEETAVAVVGRMAGAEWADGHALQPGQQVPAGTLKLERGLVSIDFVGGSRVVAEGPAVITLVSDSQLKVESGSLEVAVPPFSRGFTVDLPGSQVVSTGGSFDVKTAAGDSDLWVREGSLEATAAGQKRAVPAGEFVLLREDRGIAEGGPRAAPAEPGLSQRLERGGSGRMTRWREASAKRSADPALLVHFRMDSPREEEDGLLTNSSNYSDASRRAPIIASQWVEGRWPGKRGLSFRNSSDSAKIEIRGEHPQVTYAAWARLDELPRRFNAILISERRTKGEAHWQFSADAEFNFGVRAEKAATETGFHRAFSRPIIMPHERGVWKLLATTYDSISRQVIHYVDGKEFGRTSLPESLPLHFGVATFGNTPLPATDGVGSRCFGGIIDEFLLYGKVLSPAEIESLYQEGRPD